MSKVRLIFALHNHQPVGNFGSVFESSCRDGYEPFLDLAWEYPDVVFALHTSGPLMEWLIEQRPTYVDRLRAMCARAQVEILGGAQFEPILPNIPKRDRVGQIQAYSRYLELLFGQRIRGMWLPERVWEQSLVTDLVDAGIEFTVLDDCHFATSGLASDALFRFQLTEDEGRLLKIFPNSERMRYLTPWREPHEAYEYLREVAETSPGAVVVCADDGEKFGAWPQTYDHVYKNGWMRRFFDMLRANRSWIETTTFSRALDETLPGGKVYIADASYREMMEWALAPDRQREYRQALKLLETGEQRAVRPFVSPGGYWRNFRSRYPESDEMYCRMMGVSSRLARLEERREGVNASALDDARDHLYRAQCNCPYWHGAFGGLYLPHLRGAVFEHLIAAHNCLDEAEYAAKGRVTAETGDFNLDARQEVCLQNDSLIAWIRPSLGGHLYELDDRRTCVNLLATLDRRPEAYHTGLETPSGQPELTGHAHLADLIIYDRQPRKAFVDHVYPVGTTVDALAQGQDLERGDFATGTYLGQVEREPKIATVHLERNGEADGQALRVRKTFVLNAESSLLKVRYRLEASKIARPFLWGVEINIASMAGSADDRNYRDAQGNRLGPLDSTLELTSCGSISLADEWRDLMVDLTWTRPARVWAFPIKTVSQSEGGFEAVYQSSAVIPYWRLDGAESDVFEVEIAVRVGSVARAGRDRRTDETMVASR